MILSDNQLERYSRHIILEDIGIEGQEALLDSKVLVIGAGGLGAPVLLYLAAAGVGTLGIVDGDVVDPSNLQRQVIHFTPDVGKAKVESAAEKIALINPDVKVITHKTPAMAGNILDLIKDYDFIIDGTDNFPAKFLINDACVKAGKSYSHGGILRFDGQTLTYTPGHACYRCIFPELPPKDAVPTCSQAGVLGAIAGMLGTVQAAEAVKYLIGKGKLLTDQLLVFNALNMDFRKVKVKRNHDCPVCGTSPTIIELKDYEQPTCSIKDRKKV